MALSAPDGRRSPWRRFRSRVRSAGDLWLLARMTGWSLTLRVLKRSVPLARLERAVRAAPGGLRRNPARERTVVAFAHALHPEVGPAGHACLERSLLLYRFLGLSGAEPQLVVGMRRGDGGSGDADSWAGHAWVELDGSPVGESRASLSEFTPLTRFTAPARRAASPAPAPARPEGSPEMAVLMACAGVQPAAERRERLAELLARPLDWTRLFRLAERHGLAPLLHEALLPLRGALPPEAPVARLQQAFEQNARRAVFMTGELHRLLAALEGNGVEPVPFKGPALAAELYPNLGLRPFADLDLLVREPELPAARAALRAAGYAEDVPRVAGQERAHLRTRHEETFTRADGMVSVELQWALSERWFAFDFDPLPLWQRLGEVELGGRPVRALAPEDLLLILCAHGTKHLWTRLLWASDVARLLERHRRADWGSAAREARRLGGERMLGLGLALAQELGAGVPEALAPLAASPAVRRLLARVGERALGERGGVQPSVREMVPFHLRSRERLLDRARYAGRLALTPTDADWAPLAGRGAPAPLRHLMRPLRLAVKYAPGGRRGA